jgi:hypothetical protein
METWDDVGPIVLYVLTGVYSRHRKRKVRRLQRQRSDDSLVSDACLASTHRMHDKLTIRQVFFGYLDCSTVLLPIASAPCFHLGGGET